jgi:hypothetical protein
MALFSARVVVPLVAALLLALGVAALIGLGWSVEPPGPARAATAPRVQTEPASLTQAPTAPSARVAPRRALTPLAAPTRDRPSRPMGPPDPLLAGLTLEDDSALLHLDLRAILRSPVGRQALECLRPRIRKQLDALREEANFDVRERIHRVGGSDKTLVFSGDFEGVDFAQVFKDSTVETRDGVTLYSPREGGGEHVAVIDGTGGMDGMMVAAHRREQLEQALARIANPPEDTPRLGGADLVGVLPAEDLLQLLPIDYSVRGPLTSMLEEWGLVAHFRVDAGDALGVRVDVQANGEAGEVALEALRAALEAARGMDLPPALAELKSTLASAELERDQDGLRLGMRIPAEVVRAALGGCEPADDERHR